MTERLSVTVDVIAEVSIPTPGTAAELDALVREALAAEAQSGVWDISLALMNDAALRALHERFMGLDSVTDIMTFARGDGEVGGDIAISVERAADQASAFGLTPWEEVCFLTVHGVLHLCGWDDATDASRRRMLDRQTEIVDRWRAVQLASSFT